MPIIAGPPQGDSLIELDETQPQRRDPFYMAKVWLLWVLGTLLPAIQSAPQVKKVLRLTAQHATINTTAIPLGVLPSGQYQISYYARVTTPDGVSSSLTVTLAWTESGQALTLVGGAITGDALTSVQSGSAFVEADGASSLSYSAAYASNTPTKMQYRLTIAVVQVN